MIEAVLFYKAAPVKKAVLAKILAVGEEDLGTALKTLQERLKGGATTLVMTEDEVELAIVPDFDELIECLRKDERRPWPLCYINHQLLARK